MNEEELRSFEPSWKNIPAVPTPIELSGPNSPGMTPVDFPPAVIAPEASGVDLPEAPITEEPEPQTGEGSGGTHPWKVLFAEGDSGLTATIVPGSRFFVDLSTVDDLAVSGYSKITGAELTTAVGHFIYISFGLNENMVVDSPEIGSADFDALPFDGDFFTLAGTTPDYADTQFIPIARIQSGTEPGTYDITQYVRNHIRLGVIAVDGALIYHPM